MLDSRGDGQPQYQQPQNYQQQPQQNRQQPQQRRQQPMQAASIPQTQQLPQLAQGYNGFNDDIPFD